MRIIWKPCKRLWMLSTRTWWWAISTLSVRLISQITQIYWQLRTTSLTFMIIWTTMSRLAQIPRWHLRIQSPIVVTSFSTSRRKRMNWKNVCLQVGKIWPLKWNKSKTSPQHEVKCFKRRSKSIEPWCNSLQTKDIMKLALNWCKLLNLMSNRSLSLFQIIWKKN